jgi:hypothetical protein
MTVHENKNYVVVVDEDEVEPVTYEGGTFTAFYAVSNKIHGITEYKTPNLTSAIMYAEQADNALETKPWEWMRKQASMSPEQQFAELMGAAEAPKKEEVN